MEGSVRQGGRSGLDRLTGQPRAEVLPRAASVCVSACVFVLERRARPIDFSHVPTIKLDSCAHTIAIDIQPYHTPLSL